MTDYNGTIHSIEITFAAKVKVDEEDQKALHAVISSICSKYEKAHPGRVMWLFGYGQKILVHPMMLSDDEPIPFDESCLSIECEEREA